MRASTVQRALVLVGAVALVLAGGGLAYVNGVGPAPGGSSDDELTPAPTGTASSGPTASPAPEPFDVTIESLRECGRTCRNVTVSVSNRDPEPVSDVVVSTRMFAGNDTNESDPVWSDTERLGALGAGETRTAERRIELSVAEAYAVDQADGWVTVQTTVEAADRRVTVTQRLSVV